MKPARKPADLTIGSHRIETELEARICDVLHLRDLFAGVTDKGTRAARLKVLLHERGLVDSIAWDGVSWKRVYRDLYREAL
jgi:hypothetical protein